MGEDLRQVRIEKLQRIRDAGLNPYPERFERSHTLAQARLAGAELKEQLDQAKASRKPDMQAAITGKDTWTVG